MQILEFKPANCKNCYKCLRECPVKAIKITDSGAEIIDEFCILCGKCTRVCDQEAQLVHSSIENVKSLLKEGNVIASVAPSFISNFDVTSFAAFKEGLIKLGFKDVFETAEGAKLVTEEYVKLIETKKYKNLISTACPAVVSYVRRNYHNAIKYLTPVDSPMGAHAKLIHKEFENIKLVFIGPCIAKKKEALMINEANNSVLIDDVLTFEELDKMLNEKKIEFAKNLVDDKDNNLARYYAINRGVVKSFASFDKNYEYISVDGMDNISKVLDNIDDLEGVFFEMNACEFACVNGPSGTKYNKAVIKSVEKVRKYTRNRIGDVKKKVEYPTLDLTNKIEPIQTSKKIPTEEEIKAILAKIHKFKKEDELNCQACGFRTCRDKAIAYYNGLSDIYNCVPYMQAVAEKMNEEVIYYSPLGVITFDDKQNIININKVAKELFDIKNSETNLGYFRDYLPLDDLSLAFINNKNVIEKQSYIPKTNRYISFSLIFVKEHNMSFCLIKDVTTDVLFKQQKMENRIRLVETTNQVIDKQMRTVQEIASLLGEVTAETKVALIHLRDQFLNKGE